MSGRIDVEAIKRAHPCDTVAARLVRLRPGSSKFGPHGFTGPCPIHSPDPQAADSTRFECDANGWVCVECGGGDVIALIAKRSGLDPVRDFRKVVEQLTGEPPAAREQSDAERAAEAEAAAEEKAAREREHNEFRDAERRRAWDLYYRYGIPLSHPEAETGRRYLKLRGLDWRGLRLRFNAHARYYVPDRPKHRLVHTGPALLGAIQRDGHFQGAHSTFIDLGQPKGKLKLVDAKTGIELEAKKVRGSMKGGHIDLVAPWPPDVARAAMAPIKMLILGEGIEKVVAVRDAFAAAGRPLDAIAFWSAMNVGNLGGKHARNVPHPTLKTETGRVRLVPGPEPDLKADAIAIPDSVERLVLLGDSTSDRFSTEQVLRRASARYARPGRAVVVAWAPEGQDFDDVLRERQGEQS